MVAEAAAGRLSGDISWMGIGAQAGFRELVHSPLTITVGERGSEYVHIQPALGAEALLPSIDETFRSSDDAAIKKIVKRLAREGPLLEFVAEGLLKRFSERT